MQDQHVSTDASARPLRVLLVDDDEIDRMSVSRALSSLKTAIEIREAATGSEGVGVATAEPIDCIFLDYLLPDGDGLSTLAKLRAAGVDCPVVILTGHGDERIAVAALKAGAADYLPKSTINAEGLLRTLQQVTRLHRAEQERRSAEHEQALLMTKLLEAERHLQQSEKMASIGQLAAGVAHEINNPIGFINSNVGTLKKYLAELMRVLAAYESAEPLLQDAAARAALAALKKEIDLEYIKGDAPALIAESLDGLQRVKRIVQDLKDFSHVDQDEWLIVDLHSGLNSTLNIIHNELKYKAEVVKEYGNIPDIECRVSQLNQVFMNLLVNAAHAIETHGTITIRTGTEGQDWVWVEVIDTGTGIAPEHVKRIFEPFFTTKPVGQGTGLGLSLAYGIVDKHGGRIEVSSERGRGSTFRVCLPRQQRPAEQAQAALSPNLNGARHADHAQATP